MTLSSDGVFVKLGQLTVFTGRVTRGGFSLAGQQVQLFETYSDGKLVSIGTTTSQADGTYSLTVRPLYIGNVTASAAGAVSSVVPSRVTVTYRKATAALNHAEHLVVHAETRPGFVTSSSRQERAQILLVDSHGKQLKVLAVVNAAQRKLFAGEAQGTNSIDYTSGKALAPGTYRIVVKVIGTPVNTGAPSPVITLTVG